MGENMIKRPSTKSKDKIESIAGNAIAKLHKFHPNEYNKLKMLYPNWFKKRVKWDLELSRKAIKESKTYSEFTKKYYGAYQWLIANGYKHEVDAIYKLKIQRNEEDIIRIVNSSKCDNRLEFYNIHQAEYTWLKRYNKLHLLDNKYPSNQHRWNINKVEELLKSKTWSSRKEFGRQNGQGVLVYANKNCKWLLEKYILLYRQSTIWTKNMAVQEVKNDGKKKAYAIVYLRANHRETLTKLGCCKSTKVWTLKKVLKFIKINNIIVRTELKRKSYGAYIFLEKMSLLDETFPYKGCRKYSTEIAIKLAKKYETRMEFKKNQDSAYSFLLKHNKEALNKVFPKREKLNYHVAIKLAKKFKTKQEFKKIHYRAYIFLLKHDKEELNKMFP